jgi:hypothetical protein
VKTSQLRSSGLSHSGTGTPLGGDLARPALIRSVLFEETLVAAEELLRRSYLPTDRFQATVTADEAAVAWIAQQGHPRDSQRLDQRREGGSAERAVPAPNQAGRCIDLESGRDLEPFRLRRQIATRGPVPRPEDVGFPVTNGREFTDARVLVEGLPGGGEQPAPRHGNQTAGTQAHERRPHSHVPVERRHEEPDRAGLSLASPPWRVPPPVMTRGRLDHSHPAPRPCYRKPVAATLPIVT